jgi:SHAQKYF class myb-like DNA-binding protein
MNMKVSCLITVEQVDAGYGLIISKSMHNDLIDKFKGLNFNLTVTKGSVYKKDKVKYNNGNKYKKIKNEKLASKGRSKTRQVKKQKTWKGKNGFNAGLWLPEEQQRFIEAILLYGNEWKLVQEHIITRSYDQARSHAQKFCGKIKRSKLLDININQKRSIKSLCDQVSHMTTDKYFKTLQTLQQITNEKKKRRTKGDMNSILTDEAIIRQDASMNTEQTMKSTNIRILINPSEQENLYEICNDEDIILNNDNTFMSLKSKDKNMFINRKRSSMSSIDVHFNDTMSQKEKSKADDDFQNYFLESFRENKKYDGNVYFTFMELFRTDTVENPNFATNFNLEDEN